MTFKTSCGGTSEPVSAGIGSVWKKFPEFCGVVIGKQGLSFKYRSKIYQCCDRPVLLYCSKTWETTIAWELKQRRVERRIIEVIYGLKLVDRGLE